MDRLTENEVVRVISNLCSWTEFLAGQTKVDMPTHSASALQDCQQARELLSKLKGEEE